MIRANIKVNILKESINFASIIKLDSNPNNGKDFANKLVGNAFFFNGKLELFAFKLSPISYFILSFLHCTVWGFIYTIQDIYEWFMKFSIFIRYFQIKYHPIYYLPYIPWIIRLIMFIFYTLTTNEGLSFIFLINYFQDFASNETSMLEESFYYVGGPGPFSHSYNSYNHMPGGPGGNGGGGGPGGSSLYLVKYNDDTQHWDRNLNDWWSSIIPQWRQDHILFIKLGIQIAIQEALDIWLPYNSPRFAEYNQFAVLNKSDIQEVKALMRCSYTQKEILPGEAGTGPYCIKNGVIVYYRKSDMAMIITRELLWTWDKNDNEAHRTNNTRSLEMDRDENKGFTHPYWRS